MSWDLESPCCKCQSNSRAVMKKGSVGAASSYAMSFQWTWWVPGTAGSSLTQRHSTGWKSKNGRQITLLHNDIWQGENRKMAGKSLYLDELLIQKCKFRSFQSVNSLLRQAFPEGFMPPWRIQHESHTCSETSLRILMWNASYVQKHSS